MSARNLRHGNDLRSVLAHHDAEIVNMSKRMSNVEDVVKGLSSQQQSGFAMLNSKLDRIDGAPKLDLHRVISSVVALAVLFSMTVGGIIWVTNAVTGSQYSGLMGEQKAYNAAVVKALEKHEKLIDRALNAKKD